MTEVQLEAPTRRTRGKRKNYALLEDADEELFQQLDDDEAVDENVKEYEDPSFNPLTGEAMIVSQAHRPKKRTYASSSLTDKNNDAANEYSNEGPKRKFNEWKYEGTQNHPISFEVPKQERRGRKKKYEEWTYKGREYGKTVNDIVVKEKLLSSMKLGIDRNLPVEKIIGATIELGFPAYLVTWVGSDEADLLPAETCKRKYPQPLIRFFEKHLNFPESESNK